jgi:hypothetical protein
MTIACFCGTVYQTRCRVTVCPHCGTTTTVPTAADLRTLEQIRSLPQTEPDSVPNERHETALNSDA